MSSLIEMCQVLGTLAPFTHQVVSPTWKLKMLETQREIYFQSTPPAPPAKTVFQKGVLSVKNYWEAKLF